MTKTEQIRRQLAAMPKATNWRQAQRIARTCDRLRAKEARLRRKRPQPEFDWPF